MDPVVEHLRQQCAQIWHQEGMRGRLPRGELRVPFGALLKARRYYRTPPDRDLFLMGVRMVSA